MTKRGKAGETRVELDTYFGVQSAARTIPVLSGPEFAMLANEAYTNSSTPANRRLNPAWANPGQLPTYDWQRAVFQNAPIYSVNLNISGGTAKSRSAVSLNYFKQDGLIVNSKYDRYSIRANNDLQATKRVKIGSSIYLARDQSQVVPSNNFDSGVLATALQMHPMQPIFAADGPQSSTVFGLDGYSHFPLNTDGLYYPRQLSNPVWGTRPDVISNTRSLTRLFGTVYAEIDIMEGLKFRSSIGGDLSFSQNNNFAANVPFNFFGANNNPIRVGQGRSENGQWNWINTLSYAKTFGQKHEFTALAGTDALQGKNSGISGNAVGLLNYAEILNELNRTAEAYPFINRVRARAKLAPLTVGSKQQAMDAIMQERRVETFAEFNTWYDLTRTGRAAAFVKKEYDRTLAPHMTIFAIPQSELDLNTALKQNPGY